MQPSLSTSQTFAPCYLGFGILSGLFGGGLGGYQIYQILTSSSFPSTRDSMLAVAASIALAFTSGVLIFSQRKGCGQEKLDRSFGAAPLETDALLPSSDISNTASETLPSIQIDFSPSVEKEVEELKEQIIQLKNEYSAQNFQISYLQNQLLNLQDLTTEITDESSQEETLEMIKEMTRILEELTKNMQLSEVSSASVSGFNSVATSSTTSPKTPAIAKQSSNAPGASIRRVKLTPIKLDFEKL